MKQPTPKCVICKNRFTPIRSSLEKSCQTESCRIEWALQVVKKQKEKQLSSEIKKKPINKVSNKLRIEHLKYSAQRIVFLGKKENQICPITKKQTTDIHHKKGREGSLLLDESYWIALSREGHKYVEEHPIWAKDNGYSLSRLSND
jgi:hypothetical protein